MIWKRSHLSLFSFVLYFNTEVYLYRSTGTLLKEEQAKEAKLEVRKYRDKPRETNLLGGLHSAFSIAVPQIPAHAPDPLQRRPPRMPAT